MTSKPDKGRNELGEGLGCALMILACFIGAAILLLVANGWRP